MRLWIWVQVWVADAVASIPMTHIQLLVGVGHLLWSPDTAGAVGSWMMKQ